MVGIIDYGVCNVGSIWNMLKKVGVGDIRLIDGKEGINDTDHLILPGVGSFDSGMESLEQMDLAESIRLYGKSGKPLLGICLGMQLLGNFSEEGEKLGLRLIPMSCRRFDNLTDHAANKKMKVPHMGWDQTDIMNESPLTSGICFPQRYYFVHSYHAVCENKYSILSCDYGYKFTAAVRNENIYGVQFHPEKSHNFGMKLLKNFVTNC